MKNLEIKATQLMSKAITKNYAAKKIADPRMAKIYGIIMRKCILKDGKLYRHKDGVAYGEPVGWWDGAKMTGWMDKKAWRAIQNDPDVPRPEYDDYGGDYDDDYGYEYDDEDDDDWGPEDMNLCDDAEPDMD